MNIPDNDWKDFFAENSSNIVATENEIDKDKYFPDKSLIFRSFKLCNFEKIKVVILGQDCYHGEGQANGLCFSVNEGMKYPPSLRNILKEMSNDGIIRTSSDFTNLAKQGILFLNSSLTVVEKTPGSHLQLWESFTDNVIKYISEKKENVVFILWGNFAKKKKKFIDIDKHHILEGTHPSPLSANRGGFFNKYYFSEANKYLKQQIDWSV